jgi:hypothetical protein
MASIARPITRAAEAETDFGLPARLLLLSLGVAAGGIHLAMAPIHAGESTTEAVGFAVAGWAQIALAVALLVRPGREVLLATVVLNAAVICAYIVSRTLGLPVGADPGVAEEVAAIDVMATVFEAALVAGAVLLLIRPEIAAVRDRGRYSIETLSAAATLPLLVIVSASVALADPDIAQHGHGGDTALASSGGHSHGGGAFTDAQFAEIAEERCDLGLNTAAYWRETTIAGIDTFAGGDAATVDHNASARVQGSPELDDLIRVHTNAKGEIGDAQVVNKLAEVDDGVYDNWLRWLAGSGLTNHSHGGNELAPDDKQGMGGHLGAQPWHAMTNRAECDQLAAELQLARETALKYATVKDAKAAGWRQVTPYVPGIAAHFMNFRLVDDKFEIDKPEMILYDGMDDDARVVGLSYYLRHESGAEPTQGFTGNNDHYHRHIGLCVNDTGVIGDSTTTEEECTARGGRKANGGSGWMSHAWVVPGCESPWGVFSGASPLLDPELFSSAGEKGAGCGGSGTRDRYNLEPGTRDNTPVEVGGSLEGVS